MLDWDVVKLVSVLISVITAIVLLVRYFAGLEWGAKAQEAVTEIKGENMAGIIANLTSRIEAVERTGSNNSAEIGTAKLEIAKLTTMQKAQERTLNNIDKKIDKIEDKIDKLTETFLRRG